MEIGFRLNITIKCTHYFFMKTSWTQVLFFSFVSQTYCLLMCTWLKLGEDSELYECNKKENKDM